MKDPVVALAISDVHLSIKAPIARSIEADWLKAMARSLREIKDLSVKYKAPVLIAGDIFDKWNAPAELINWAIQELPPAFSIPGNHDLPMHQPELIHRSAYWTLVQSGRLQNVTSPIEIGDRIFLYATPFEGKIPERKKKSGLHICLIHQYLWIPGTEFNGASQDTRLSKWARPFSSFNTVIIGDNHCAFDRVLKSGTHVINCGSVFRRKTSEAQYCPRVGLIHQSGKVSEHRLDISKDKLLLTVSKEAEQADDAEISDFVQELAGLTSTGLDFRDAMKQAMKMRKSPKLVRKLVMEAMESSHAG